MLFLEGRKSLIDELKKQTKHENIKIKLITGMTYGIDTGAVFRNAD